MSLRGESRNPRGSEPGVPKAVVGRLGLYLRQLERFVRDGTTKVSSRRLGEALGISDAQVRKDLAYFGQFGQAGIGYQAEELMQAIRRAGRCGSVGCRQPRGRRCARDPEFRPGTAQRAEGCERNFGRLGNPTGEPVIPGAKQSRVMLRKQPA